MKTLFSQRNIVLLQAAALLFLGLTVEVNSQPRTESVLSRTQRIQQKQSLVMEQQLKTLQKLEELKKDANQTRIFAKRG